MLQTMPDLKWNVQVHSWSWVYAFTKKGAVSWRDPYNGMTGNGSWKLENGKLVTRWFGSKTVEYWDVPIDAHAATGKCHMKEGIYDLRAQAINFVEIDTPVAFTRTEDSKKAFEKGCNAANGKILIAITHFSGWLSSIAIAYESAFKAHNDFTKDIGATRQLAHEFLLGAALTFLGGGVGGIVGGAMKRAESSDFMIDAIKDLGKIAVRGPGGALLKATGITPMPLSPLQWQNSVNERVMKELSIAAKQVDEWRTRMEQDDETFDASFDPAEEMDKALAVRLPPVVRIADLPEVDKAFFQNRFEQGFLAKWIELRDFSFIDVVRASEMGKAERYGKKLGLSSIDSLLAENCPPIKEIPLKFQ